MDHSCIILTRSDIATVGRGIARHARWQHSPPDTAGTKHRDFSLFCVITPMTWRHIKDQNRGSKSSTVLRMAWCWRRYYRCENLRTCVIMTGCSGRGSAVLIKGVPSLKRVMPLVMPCLTCRPRHWHRACAITAPQPEQRSGLRIVAGVAEATTVCS